MLTAADYQKILADQDKGLLYLWLFVLLAFVCYAAFRLLTQPIHPRPPVYPPGYKPELDKRPPSRPLFHISAGAFELAIWLGGLLRWLLCTRPLWYDEAFTAAMVKAPDFSTALVGDVHPPGYYLIVRLFSAVLGTSEFALRLPSLIAGMVLIYVVYRLALSYTGDKQTARLAGMLTALLPALIQYSAEARYPMLLALAALSAVLAARENRPLLFTLCAGACAWLHAVGILYCGVLCLAAIVSRRWWACAVLAGILTLPCLLLALLQAHDVADGFWLLDSNPLWHLIDMTIVRKKGSGLVILLTYLPVMAVTLMALWHGRKWFREPFFAALTVLPFLAWGISLVWHPVYLSRTFIAPTLLLVMLWAVYLRHSWRARLAIALTIILSTAALFAPVETIQLDEVFQHCQGANTVYETSTHMAINALYYSPAPVEVWSGGDGESQTLPDSSKRAMGMNVIDGMTGLHGNICIIEMVNYLTTAQEYAHIRAIEMLYRPTVATIPFNGLMHYRVLRFHL